MSAFIEIIDNTTNGLRKWFQRFKGGERVSLLSGTTNALIEKIFPPEHREEVANILIYECGNNLRDHKWSNEHGLERIRFAVLKMSLGDVQRLRRAVKLAKRTGGKHLWEQDLKSQPRRMKSGRDQFCKRDLLQSIKNGLDRFGKRALSARSCDTGQSTRNKGRERTKNESENGSSRISRNEPGPLGLSLQQKRHRLRESSMGAKLRDIVEEHGRRVFDHPNPKRLFLKSGRRWFVDER